MTNNHTSVDELGENHIATNAKNPLRNDAFELSDDKKIELIKNAWDGFD
jgi:GTP cyclohydrolase I